MATQKDVAREAGVSQATVSLVLSGADGITIPDETIERVNQAVSLLGYTPNRSAQALRTNRTMMIACVVPDITNPFYPSLVRGVQSIAETSGYDVITVNTDGLKERELHFLNLAGKGQVDGMVGVFFHLRASDFATTVQQGTPIVRLEATRKHGGSLALDDIFIDNFAAAQEITQFLLARGHKSIAMIAGLGGPQSVRVDGYESVLQSAGLQAQVVLDDTFTEEGGLRATNTLLESNRKPSAIIAANDLMAIGAMHALHQRNINVPEQMAVAGFDDIPASRLVSPALTTVSQFQNNLGEEAAKQLLARLTGEVCGPGQCRELPFRIVERAST